MWHMSRFGGFSRAGCTIHVYPPCRAVNCSPHLVLTRFPHVSCIPRLAVLYNTDTRAYGTQVYCAMKELEQTTQNSVNTLGGVCLHVHMPREEVMARV